MKKKYALLLLISLSFTIFTEAQVTLSQTTTDAITQGAVRCGTNTETYDNIYYRSFDLLALGYTQFEVTEVSFAIQTLETPSPGFAVDVIIYSNSGGTFPAGVLTPIANVSVPLTTADSNSIKTVPIMAIVVAPAQLVFGVSIPYQSGDTTLIVFGANSDGQSAPGYISSQQCDVTSPTNLADIGFPNTHLIMSVTGSTLSTDEFELSKVSISPNPTSDYVNIKMHPSNSISAVEIYSVLGQLVLKTENETRINISNLQTGVYMMKVITTNGTSSEKLIKK
ncbi:MAG: T9SS type A sorting domain-containing protein [Aquaticitalea sp.]